MSVVTTLRGRSASSIPPPETWTIGKLPVGTARCLAVSTDGPTSLVLELFDRRVGEVPVGVQPDRDALGTLLGEGVRPVSVLLTRRGNGPLTARCLAVSSQGGPNHRPISVGVAIAILESGVQGTLRSDGDAQD